MNRLSVYVSLIAVFFVAGCASAPKSEQDKGGAAAAEKSKSYLHQVELISAEEKGSDKPCVVPAVADKPAPGESLGPSKDWRVLISHANTCVREKNWKTLEVLASAMARVDMDSPWGAYYLSLSAEGSGHAQRALWMADLAQRKAGGQAGLFAYQKARVLFGMGEVNQAMKEAQRSIALDDRLAEAHFFLAEIHHRDLEFDVAASHYEAALKGNGSMAKAMAGLAEVRLQKGDKKEASDLYSRALALQTEPLRWWLRLAYIYEVLDKNHSQALSTYRGLKSSIDRGQVRERPVFDLGAKIKTLEGVVHPRGPAQANVEAAKTEKK